MTVQVANTDMDLTCWCNMDDQNVKPGVDSDICDGNSDFTDLFENKVDQGDTYSI